MKIALVALSGVRVRNERLAALGVSLPGFVERGEVIASLPSLGLLTIAGATPPHHELAYFEAGDVTPEQLVDEGFELVALSTFTAQAHEAYAFADACRNRGCRTAMGGLHASVLPEEALQHVDHVFQGDGEEIWPEFLDDLERGEARALYDARSRPFDLAKSPCPRYDLLDVERYNRITLQAARSCPHACTFCASGPLLRGPYRKKPLELVERDLAAIEALWPRPFIELADDNTFVDHAWGLDLVRTIGRHGVKWFTETDITLADDPELLRALAASGCRQVLIGFESLSDAGLADIEARPFKAGRVAGYADAVRRIQSHGISVNGCFILGTDEQTKDDLPRVAAFADAVGLAEVQVTALTPFPGTPLYDRLLREGRILSPGDWSGCTLFDVTFRPARMSVAELELGLEDLFRRLYTPERVRARRRTFHAQCRQARRSVA